MKNKATLICVMDTSGSMGYTKKNLSKKYFYMFKGILDGRYDDVECKFIKHTTVAKQVDNINDLIYKGESGGTYLSSGANLALEVIEKEANPYERDVFTVFFSDGDNWEEDNDYFVKCVNHLCDICINVQFVEVKTSTYASSILYKINTEVSADNFNFYKISTEESIKAITSEMFDKDFKMNTFSIIRANDKNRLNDDIVKIERIKNKTIVELYNGVRGISICNDKDTYDEELGFKIAKTRAELKSKEEELLNLIGVDSNERFGYER